MNLVEEYLQAVAALLPRDQRDDIIAELRDTVLSRIEAREAEIGRPLNDAEIEAVLREIGHPIAVAAGYGEGPRHAVGPTLYPYWAFAVKAAVTLQAVIALIVVLVRSAATGNFGAAFGAAIGSAITGSLIMVGGATLIAWVVERRLVKIDHAHRWRVRELAALRLAAWDWRDVGRTMTAVAACRNARGVRTRDPDRRRRDRVAEGLCAIVGGGFVLLWWAGLLPFAIPPTTAQWRQLGIDLGALAAVDWSALKVGLSLPVVAWCFLIMGKGAAFVTRPEARRLHGGFDLALGVLVLGVVGWLWVDSPIADLIRVNSGAELVLRIKDAFPPHGPVDLTPFLTLAVLCATLSGLTRVARGVGLVILGSSRPSAPVTDGAAPQPT